MILQSIKYKNISHKKTKNAFPLEVSCGHCKTSLLIYDKAGRGNLIKLQKHRIIESEFDLEKVPDHLHCFNCGGKLANKGVYRGNLTYFIIRGKINIKKLDNYR